MTRPACPVCGFVVGAVSPQDGAIALRSFPRRFSDLLSPKTPTEEAASGETATGADAERRRTVVAEHADAAALAIRVATAALELTLVENEPILGTATQTTTVSDQNAVERLRDSAEQLAALADRTRGSQWTRTATRGNETVTALDLLDEGVHAGSHHLRVASDELG